MFTHRFAGNETVHMLFSDRLPMIPVLIFKSGEQALVRIFQRDGAPNDGKAAVYAAVLIIIISYILKRIVSRREPCRRNGDPGTCPRAVDACLICIRVSYAVFIDLALILSVGKDARVGVLAFVMQGKAFIDRILRGAVFDLPVRHGHKQHTRRDRIHAPAGAFVLRIPEVDIVIEAARTCRRSGDVVIAVCRRKFRCIGAQREHVGSGVVQRSFVVNTR